MPKVTTLIGWGVGVRPSESNPEQTELLAQDPVTGDTLIIPFDREPAQKIGKDLLAPRVAQASGPQLVLPR